MEELEITCKIELKDLLRFYKKAYCLLLLIIFVFPLISFLGLLFGVSSEKIINEIVRQYKEFLPILIMSVVLYIIFMVSLYKHRNYANPEHNYRFSEEGISIKNAHATAFYKYSEVRRVRNRKKFLAITFYTRTAILLPTNDENCESIQKIYALLQEKCDNIKGKKK